MNLFNAIAEKDNLRAAVRLLRFFIIVIGAAVLYLGYQVERSVNYQKIILVPFGLDRNLEISGEGISEEGAEMYARRAALLRANYSASTARKNFNLLLKMYAPEAYPEAWKLYYDLADRVETANVTSVFFIEKLVIDTSGRIITVTGQNRKYKDNSLLSDTVLNYVISYGVDRGMFQVLSIEEKEKT